ncbi:MAG: phosphatidylglycerol lysyltransferase domain-containing protein, partial [Acidimicrobiales bacterium]
VMLLAGKSSIRDVILFPTLRPARDTLGPGDGARTPVVPTVALPTAVRPGAPVGFVRLSGLVRVVAGLTAVVGALTILTAVPRLGVRAFLVEELVSPLPVAVENRVLAITIGVILVLLSSQLLRAKRRAWALTLGVFVASVGVSVASGGELVALLTSGAMIVILLLTRREFTGLRDPPSVFAVARLVPRYLVVVYGYGIVALLGQRIVLEPSFTLWRSIQAITAGLFGFEGPYTYRGRFDSWFPTSLVVLGAVGLLLLGWLLLRPAVRVGSRDGRPRARELVDRYGWDSLAPFALRRDRSYFFSSDGKAMVAYGYLGGFALVTGDPIGERASIPLVVDEFLEFCRLHGWQPAFLAAREVDVPFYAERGFRDFYLGDEAILDCRRFDLEGPGMAPVRQSVRRIQRGHRFELIREASAPADLTARLNEISDQWRKGEDERGYTMAMSTDVGTDDPDRLLAIAWCTSEDDSRPETPVGFLRLVPTGDPDGRYGRGYTLDMMRRLPGSANGLTEFLVANTVEALDRQGVPRLSLNFASFARLLDDDVQHTRFDRFLRRIVELINPYYQISSLLEFNEKFQPEWLPRVLIYADPADLPKVALRYAWLEGFFDVPLLGRLLSGPADAVAADEILS